MSEKYLESEEGSLSFFRSYLLDPIYFLNHSSFMQINTHCLFANNKKSELIWRLKYMAVRRGILNETHESRKWKIFEQSIVQIKSDWNNNWRYRKRRSKMRNVFIQTRKLCLVKKWKFNFIKAHNNWKILFNILNYS
jgi:hypothetical protein